MSNARTAGALCLLLLGMAGGCSSPTEAERLLERTDRAQALWLRTRPLEYELLETRICECLPEWTGPVRLTVTRRQGARSPFGSEMIVSGTLVAGGAELDAERLAVFRTVTGLFAEIRAAITSGAEVVEAEFDPVRGYPREVLIDPDRGVGDDEIGYRLEVLGPGS